MSQKQKAFFILLIAATLLSCDQGKNDTEESLKESSSVYTKDSLVFGTPRHGKEKVVEIEAGNYESFEQLADRIEEIVCHDSVPAFIIDSDRIYKTIYTINPCWKLYACLLTYQRNVMGIQNDSIISNFDVIQPLDSLAVLLKTQINHLGQSEDYADSFKKLIFTIEQDSLDPLALEETLDHLTDVFYTQNKRTDIHIRIDQFIQPINF